MSREVTDEQVRVAAAAMRAFIRSRPEVRSFETAMRVALQAYEDTIAEIEAEFFLSEREYETLRWLSQGLVYKQIAREMQVSTSTIRTHMHKLYKKLGVIDRGQATALFLQGKVGLNQRGEKQN